ncbi:helix-turn-helix domain-containing protein [Agrobacterium pusense]|uniref:helix-turn-helix domain-containing protein n=1 Tax=Agrobacterium pusense TaxID=648995 RepID=UPI0028AD5CDC|nr:helix-turn-helix domain-containing protein [Agrobacterium pusense]
MIRPFAPCDRNDRPGDSQVVESALRRAARSAFGPQFPEKTSARTADALQCLEDIGAELNLLFAYRVEAETHFAQMSPTGLPVLHLGRSIGLDLSLEIEVDTGHFILVEEGGPFPSVLVTASDARVVDQIVSIVGSVYDPLTPRTVDDAVDVLVGQSIRDVECRLILRTMRYFRGNGSHAAFALGIDEAQLTELLNRHLVASRAASARTGGSQ